MFLNFGTPLQRPFILRGLRFYGIATKWVAIGFFLRPKEVSDDE